MEKMQGIPKVPMISPDMKIPDDPMPVEWIPKLREYIFTHYNDDPSKFNEAFKELSSMRYHACRYSADTESICIMKRYFAQLQMMKSRFPMETNEPVSVPFAWSDRSCDMAVGAAYEDINYEICCIMYNIGAAHATIAMNETRSDENSCKNAFQNFQYASWPFEYLRDNLGASRFASSNFEPELLTFFSQILLVQAHECLLEKAICDNRASSITAKLARYAAEAYFELKLRLDQDTLSDYILSSKLKTWKRLCEAKAHFYEAIKRYALGQHCYAAEQHGESVAHLSAALEQIKEAQKVVQKDKRESESMKQVISFALDIITQEETRIRKENDFVYHDRVPRAEDLTQVEPVTKAQALSFDPFKRDTCGDDLFAALLPANVLKGVSMYSEEKAKLKREIIQKIEKKDTDLEQHLLSLQLNQLNLDQNLDEMRLPEELLQASAAFTAQPHALFELLDQLNVVATKSSEAEIKLTDLRHRLLNVKCPQLEEDQGFKIISSKVDELMDHHIQARANNTELQKALASQSEQLKLLALPLTELAKNICDKVVNVSETPEGKKLSQMVEKVEEMKKGRILLFESLKTDLENDDITAKVLAEKDFSMDALFEKELKKHAKAIQMIEMNLDAQDKILNALTEANANFAECRRDIVENNEKRRSQSVALITAYQVFTGVKDKTEAATTFYNQLFALIRALDKSITGMEDSFKGERERHEEEKRILAEKTKLYRERTAMELSNDQPQLPLTATERRRPKLGDYMAFYRNKMAASQNSTALNGSTSQQYVPPPSNGTSQPHQSLTPTLPTFTTHQQQPITATSHPNYAYANPQELSKTSAVPSPSSGKSEPEQQPHFYVPPVQQQQPANANTQFQPSNAYSNSHYLPSVAPTSSNGTSQPQQSFSSTLPTFTSQHQQSLAATFHSQPSQTYSSTQELSKLFNLPLPSNGTSQPQHQSHFYVPPVQQQQPENSSAQFQTNFGYSNSQGLSSIAPTSSNGTSQPQQSFSANIPTFTSQQQQPIIATSQPNYAYSNPVPLPSNGKSEPQQQPHFYVPSVLQQQPKNVTPQFQTNAAYSNSQGLSSIAPTSSNGTPQPQQSFSSTLPTFTPQHQQSLAATSHSQPNQAYSNPQEFSKLSNLPSSGISQPQQQQHFPVQQQQPANASTQFQPSNAYSNSQGLSSIAPTSSNGTPQPQQSFSANIPTFTSQQQQPITATSQSNYAYANPQELSKISIAPSPYANMYKKPKQPVSNIAVNSPWHRNIETNPLKFEKK